MCYFIAPIHSILGVCALVCSEYIQVKRQFVPNRRRPIQFGIFYAEKQKMWYSPAEKLCAEKAQFIKNKFELRSIFFWILIE